MSSRLTWASLWLFLWIARVEAAEVLDLLSGGAAAWSCPDRVSRCPVHAPISPKAADSGGGLTFAVAANARSGKYRYSVIESGVSGGGLADAEGLLFEFSKTDLKSFKVRLYDGQWNVRFIYVVDKPDGVHSILIPWSAFTGEKIRRTGITACEESGDCQSVQPHVISLVGVLLPYGSESSQLTLHKVRAYHKDNLAALSDAGAVVENQKSTDGPTSFSAPSLQMGPGGTTASHASVSASGNLACILAAGYFLVSATIL